MTTSAAGADDDYFQFSVRYCIAARKHDQAAEAADSAPWLDYSHHPASKLGLHNALLAVHDRREILQARGEYFECCVFLVRHGQFEPLTQVGAERLFASLPSGNVKWLDLCQCLLPPISEPPDPTGIPAADPSSVGSSVASSRCGQMPLFPHIHTPYDDLDEHPSHHALDTEV